MPAVLGIFNWQRNSMTQNLKFDRQFFRDLWQLLKPYWKSEEKWSAFLLLFVIVGCIIAQIRISVAFNYFRKDFFNALQKYNKPLLTHLIGYYVLLLVAAILVYGYNVYFSGLLTIRWRRWLTKHYLDNWLAKQTYYRMQALNKSVDNPDQRISEDLDNFPTAALSIFTSLFEALLTIFAFGIILWGLSGDLTFPLGKYHIVIPGYLLWAALLYAGLGTWLNALLGRPLANLNYLQQRYNANFRFGMARLREVSEQVAMYRGEKTENHKFLQSFKQIFDNFINIIIVQRRLVFFQNGYTAASFVFGLMIAMPLFFANKIQIGGVVQITHALDTVITSFSLFIFLFTTLATWRSVIFRLTEFSQAMQQTKQVFDASKIAIVEDDNFDLRIQDLNLMLPDGTCLLTQFNLVIHPGETLLFSGPTGIGKSTLLHALAKIWPYGEGQIFLPKNKKLMFLPQKPYLPLGTLREALLYPSQDETISDQYLKKLLVQCGLEKLQPELETTRNWAHELSLGEQQLIAFARIFLQQPDWIFLDEATSALDEANEMKMYQMLHETLPHATIVSAGHRSSLKQLHQRIIDLREITLKNN